MAIRVPALIQLSDPRVAAQLVYTIIKLVNGYNSGRPLIFCLLQKWTKPLRRPNDLMYASIGVHP